MDNLTPLSRFITQTIYLSIIKFYYNYYYETNANGRNFNFI